MDDTPAVKQLKGLLTALPPGEVAVPGALIALLAGCWHELDGGAAEGMKTSKLARMEDVRWESPILSFQLERHGALALGSTRAELQVWSVDCDNNLVSCAKSRSYRQRLPRRAGKGRADCQRNRGGDNCRTRRPSAQLGDETEPFESC